ncbi:hypothetical protein [Kordiimonas aestuarii]|uniref:hypothetical protein n=1 Tax=Kordiimonas aestuarii TaxID=1005925 RepID=UPI0021CEF214|nr:hypothetical protein [Kordiimonas aestuarii]
MLKAIKISTATCVFVIIAAVFPAPSAQAAADIMQVAHDSARVAGGARYCNADEELVEEYIGKSEGKIAAMAKDDYEKVVASLEFKNILTAMSAKEPEGGCREFLPTFEKAVKAER